ncbi:MAG: FtsX-like permease family protein [Proteobacteria bacterium]|nr:FtsX-like permease family protein [Pseudomonadota bacterium]
MFSRRSDLLHDKDSLNRFLPWLIAFMVFLVILAMAGMLVLNATAARWDKGISGTLTVQIMPGENSEKDADRLQQVLSILARMPEVARYEALSDDQLMVLLEPWLGVVAGARDLPLPGLVDVELKPDADLDVAAFAKRLAARVPGTAVDDHRVWLDRLVNLIQTAQALAALVVVFIVLTTIGTVVFTTQTGLVIHRDAIEVLHLIGAQDSYIARQFAGRALALGLKGGLIGLLLALPTLFGIVTLARQMDSSILPDFTLTPVHWAILTVLPLAVAFIAMLTARLTVMNALSRML